MFFNYVILNLYFYMEDVFVKELLRHVRQTVITYLKTADLMLIIMSILCSSYGIVLVASATSSMSRRLIAIQLFAAFVGFVLMIIISRIDYQNFSELWLLFLAAGFLILIVTFVFGTGPSGTTNRNWLRFGPVSIQPSEFVKLAYIIVMASVISRFGENINAIRNLAVTLGIATLLLAPLALTGDLGMLIVYVFILAVMLFIAGLSIWYFAGVIAAGAIAIPFMWTYVLHNYQKNRIIFGFNPELDPTDVGYQAVQGKIAIGSGGMVGKGLFEGTQVQNGYVPAHHTDYIFSVAGEELGFIGALAVVVLLVAVMIRIYVRSLKSEDSFGSLLCIGIFATFVFQVFINIMMCLGMFPVIGITLPFFSYGGSSMLSSFMAMGIVLSVSCNNKTLSFKPY